MNSYLNKLFEKKNISLSSKMLYYSNLKKLNDGTDFDNLDFLKDKNKVEEIIKTKKENTQRNYLISIVSVLKTATEEKENEEYKKLYDYYYEKMMKMNNDLKEKEKENTKTETQKKNWIEFPAVQNKLLELIDEIKGYNYKKITKGEYNNILKMLVLGLYTLTPPRRNKDYQTMVLKNGGIPKNDNINYYDKKNNEFIFRNYKTSKKELENNKEGLKIKIPHDLQKIINVYLLVRPKNKSNNFLLYHDGGEFKNSNCITYILNDIFKKNVSSSMLRHIYLSHHYKDLLPKIKEMGNISTKMSHSKNMQQDYIKKD